MAVRDKKIVINRVLEAMDAALKQGQYHVVAQLSAEWRALTDPWRADGERVVKANTKAAKAAATNQTRE